MDYLYKLAIYESIGNRKNFKGYQETIGKKYGFKQCDYINWKIKDGYFFELDTTYVVNTELRVKPLFMDDLYWKIIYPHKEMKLSDSLRGTSIIWRMPDGKDKDKFEFILEYCLKKIEETSSKCSQ